MIAEITLVEGDVVKCVAYTGPNNHYTVGRLYNVTEHFGVLTVCNNNGTRAYEGKARFKLMRANWAPYEQLEQAEKTIKSLKSQLEAESEVPDNIAQAYLDGYLAALETAQSIELRIAPELDAAIRLGVNTVTSVLKSDAETLLRGARNES